MFPAGKHIIPGAALAASLLASAALAQTDYHEQSLGYHLGRYIVLRTSGHRMVSLDVAGSLNDQRWSAVWEQEAGPEWTALHGATETELTQWQTEQKADGYRTSWITSAGSGLNRVYGCIMVKDGRESSCSLNMSAPSFDAHCDSAHTSGWLLTSVSVHGAWDAPLYAAVFEANPEGVRWALSTGDSAADHQTKVNAFVSQAWARPAIVTMSDSMSYTSVYHDDEVGSWAARHDLTKTGYEAQKLALAASGYRPLQIMVSGHGAGTRYAALFVKDSPAARVRTTSGVVVPAFAGVDELMQGKLGPRGWEPGFLQDTNARAAAVAIAKDGNLVFARGYTWAVAGHPITQPTTNFRLASCSKPLTAFAMFHLDEKRADVSMSSKLLDLVDFGRPKDGRFADVTLTHLINHRSGYRGWWGEGCTDKLAAAKASVGSVDLVFDPGSQEEYSNGGYMMLGLALEQKSGQSYFQYLQQNVLAPLGISRAHLIAKAPQSGDARCQEMGWGGSRTLGVWASSVHSGNPIVNGAYSISDKAVDASGGVDMSVVDYVRVLAGIFDHNVKPAVLSKTTRDSMEAMIETSGRTGGFDKGVLVSNGTKSYRYYEKGGLWRSAHTYVVHRSDGVSIAAFCSGPSAPPIGKINALVDGVAAWPQHDLFPTYGLPAFLKGADGSYRAFGTSCAGSTGTPVHDAIGLPEIGKSPFFHLSKGPKSSVTVLELGFSDKLWGALPLPLELTSLGAPGCRVYAPQTISFAVPTYADGSAGLTLAIPDAAGLIGVKLYTQFMSADKAANALGLTFSNGLETMLGGWK